VPTSPSTTSPSAICVDDIVSFDPWNVRCLEIRGIAEALSGQAPPNPYLSSEVIRIHPRRIISWGLGVGGQQGSKRNVG
jgi:pyridoxamine 5'-phosphate oxidase family protein